MDKLWWCPHTFRSIAGHSHVRPNCAPPADKPPNCAPRDIPPGRCGFSLFQSQSSKSPGSSPHGTSSTVVLHFIEIPYSSCFEGSCARAPYSITSVLSLPRAVRHLNTALSTEDASSCQVAIGDSDLSGIEKGLRQTGVIWSLLVIELDLLINVAEGLVGMTKSPLCRLGR